LIITNNPVKIAEDYATLQHLAAGRVDLMMGRGNTGPVYQWFGQDIPTEIALATGLETFGKSFAVAEAGDNAAVPAAVLHPDH
jgi:alkanesulfonate monooxygenase SsuD/methylene tetrahydromethanopterin reductase-like flavin-dependent oxidoreductase (luciferase family)